MVMTIHDRDKVIAAAKETDEDFTGNASFNLGDSIIGIDAVEHFYAIAFEAGRVAEREECAKVCPQLTQVGYYKINDDSMFHEGFSYEKFSDDWLPAYIIK